MLSKQPSRVPFQDPAGNFLGTCLDKPASLLKIQDRLITDTCFFLFGSERTQGEIRSATDELNHASFVSDERLRLRMWFHRGTARDS